MNTRLKQRLLGAVILIALIVIFVPMLFNKHAQNGNEMVKEAPAAPAVDSSMPQVTAPHEDAAVGMTESVSQPAAAEQETAAALPTPAAPSAATPPATPPEKAVAVAPPTAAPAIPAAVASSTQPVVAAMPKPAVAADAPDGSAAVDAVSKTEPVQHMSVTPAATPAASAQKGVEVAEAEPVDFQIRQSDVSSSNVEAPTPIQPTPLEADHLKAAKAHNQAWVVQMGSFSDATHAASLIQKLRAHQFTAFSYNTKQGDKLITKVYVGPVASHDKAQAMQTDILKTIKAKGFVAKFNALDLG